MYQPQVQSPLKNYIIEKQLGEGSFAKVFLGRHKTTKEQVAIKEIEKPRQSQIDIDREIAVLMTLENPNIMKLIETEESQNHIYLILEFCSFGDLEQVMEKYFCKKGFPEDLAQMFIQQLQYAFIEMSSKGIIHRDLKLANILMNHKLEIKIADFGLAKYSEYNKNMTQSKQVGTPLTMAPEVLNERSYNQQCDIWSFGIILYHMVYGDVPFNPGPGKGMISLVNMIEQAKGKPLKFPENKQVSEQLKNLISSMLKYDPEERITIEQFVNDPWVSEPIDIEQIKEKHRNQFQTAQNCLDKQLQIHFGKKLRDLIENNVNQFLDKLKELIHDLEKLDNFNTIMDILQQLKLFLEEFQDYTFEVNNEKLSLHQHIKEKIIELKDQLPIEQIEQNQKEQIQSDLQNKSGILGIPHNFMKNMLKIVGLVQENTLTRQQSNQKIEEENMSKSQQKQENCKKKVSLELCNFMLNSEDNYKIIEKIKIEGTQKKRVNNISIPNAYLTDEKQFQNQQSLKLSKKLSQKQQAQQSNQQQYNQQYNNFGQFNPLNFLQNQQEEQVEQIDIDEDDFFDYGEEEDGGSQINSVYNNENMVNNNNINNHEKEEITEDQIRLDVEKYYSPFYNEDELENIKLIQSFYKSDS